VTARFGPGQVVTVFRSRLRGDVDPSYASLEAELRERAHTLGGLVDVTSFVADDGERVTVVTFEDRASHRRWATDPVHRDAQRLGREGVYSAYSIQVADCTHTASFDLDAAAPST
jgi:heme-degrading monooxygenase HmoA